MELWYDIWGTCVTTWVLWGGFLGTWEPLPRIGLFEVASHVQESFYNELHSLRWLSISSSAPVAHWAFWGGFPCQAVPLPAVNWVGWGIFLGHAVSLQGIRLLEVASHVYESLPRFFSWGGFSGKTVPLPQIGLSEVASRVQKSFCHELVKIII